MINPLGAGPFQLVEYSSCPWVPGSWNPTQTSLKMDVFLGETANHFPMCKDLDLSSSN